MTRVIARRRWHSGDYLPPLMAAFPARHDPYASLRIANFRWFVISLRTMNVATQRRLGEIR
jgi:hypothetical protein